MWDKYLDNNQLPFSGIRIAYLIYNVTQKKKQQILGRCSSMDIYRCGCRSITDILFYDHPEYPPPE